MTDVSEVPIPQTPEEQAALDKQVIDELNTMNSVTKYHSSGLQSACQICDNIVMLKVNGKFSSHLARGLGSPKCMGTDMVPTGPIETAPDKPGKPTAIVNGVRVRI